MTETERNEVMVYMPAAGYAFPIQKVKDPVFAQGMLGRGFAIMPTDGGLYAPIDGEISMLANTLHSVAITSPEGVEILIHVGMDTVNLAGKYFNAEIIVGQSVKCGEKLLHFNYDALINEGFDITIPVVLINPDEFEISEQYFGEKIVGDSILKIQRKGT
jgi:glucose-specific phosphotransferase system IIA component